MNFTDLQGKSWTIQSINAADNPGVAKPDNLEFALDTSGATVTITRVFTDSSGVPTSTPWANSCSFTSEGDLTGVAVGGQSFLITSSPLTSDPTKQQLTCRFVDTSTQQRRVKAAGTSALLGALIGAVAGYAAGLPFVGALIGFATALTGSVVTAASTVSLGARYTSAGTWVADDGSGTRLAFEPQPLKVVRA